jgi:hypothetical protein
MTAHLHIATTPPLPFFAVPAAACRALCVVSALPGPRTAWLDFVTAANIDGTLVTQMIFDATVCKQQYSALQVTWNCSGRFQVW